MAFDCSDCMYFDEGVCRRLAPASGGFGASSIAAQWPQVKSSDWCGDWRGTDEDWRIDEEDPRVKGVGALVAGMVTGLEASSGLPVSIVP